MGPQSETVPGEQWEAPSDKPSAPSKMPTGNPNRLPVEGRGC